MRVRLAVKEDMDAVLSMAEEQVVEAHSHLPFDREIAEASFHEGISNGDLLIVAEGKDGKLVGFLGGRLHGYSFCAGVFVNLDILYVRPDKRGTRAAAELLLEYLRWGQIVGAREIYLGTDNPQMADRTARVYERLGAERVGYQHRIIARGQ